MNATDKTERYDVHHWDGDGYATTTWGGRRITCRNVSRRVAEKAVRECSPPLGWRDRSHRMVLTGGDAPRHPVGSLTPGGKRGPRS